MDGQVELEICANCKREIPHTNYVMHTAHCARNIALCPKCKEAIPKPQFEEHKKICAMPTKASSMPKAPPKPSQPPAKIEHSEYFQSQRAIEDKKVQKRQEQRLAKYDRLVDAGDTLGHVNGTTSAQNGGFAVNGMKAPAPKPKSDLLPCQYCELELPKFDLGEHENYCGARTEKCEDCGELVMFKYRQLHQDTNHGFMKLNDGESRREPGPRPSWDTPRRTVLPDSPTHRRPSPFRSFSTFDTYTSGYPFTTSFSTSALPTLATNNNNNNGEKLETSREISRRLDCKTEYIRNLLHDSASITAPLRSTGAIPRHLKGPGQRRRNPPTELLIPCEFCNTPIPHEDLIEHETGCRPDLARFNPRRRADSPDYFIAPEPSSPDVELPCEFCADLIPASQLLSHQATCT